MTNGRIYLKNSQHSWYESTQLPYDMQQIIRYNRAYAIHPEGGYTVDYREPLIKESLAPIECKCYMKEEICTEEIGLSHEHVLILNEALSIWSMLLRMHISELIGWYTDDVVAIDVSRVLDKMYPKTDIFSEKLDSIVKLQKKILACCGEEIA